jgi:hypothetical protein
MKRQEMDESLSTQERREVERCATELRLKPGAETKEFAESVNDMYASLTRLGITLSPEEWEAQLGTILLRIFKRSTPSAIPKKGRNAISA